MIVSLDDSLAPVKDCFNANLDKIKFIALVSST